MAQQVDSFPQMDQAVIDGYEDTDMKNVDLDDPHTIEFLEQAGVYEQMVNTQQASLNERAKAAEEAKKREPEAKAVMKDVEDHIGSSGLSAVERTLARAAEAEVKHEMVDKLAARCETLKASAEKKEKAEAERKRLQVVAQALAAGEAVENLDFDLGQLKVQRKAYADRAEKNPRAAKHTSEGIHKLDAQIAEKKALRDLALQAGEAAHIDKTNAKRNGSAKSDDEAPRVLFVTFDTSTKKWSARARKRSPATATASEARPAPDACVVT